MIVEQLPTIFCMRQESQGMRAVNLLVQDFSSFAFLFSWEPGNEQTD
jgi:hypothetical protein